MLRKIFSFSKRGTPSCQEGAGGVPEAVIVRRDLPQPPLYKRGLLNIDSFAVSKHLILSFVVFLNFIFAAPAQAKDQAQIYTAYLALTDQTTPDALQILSDGDRATKICAENDAECHYYAALIDRERIAQRLANAKTEWPLILNHLASVVVFNDSLDQGGAYRTLGQIYLNLPKSPYLGKTLMQNLDLAWESAAKSLRVAALDPRNLLLAGQVRLAQKDTASAGLYLKNAKAELAGYKGPKAEKARLKAAIDEALKNSEIESKKSK